MKWPTKPIGELCIETEQRDPGVRLDDPFEYIDISSVDKDLKSIAETRRLVGKEAPSRARKVVKSGDVLVSTVRPNLNAVALVPEGLNNQIASTGYCVLRTNPKVLDNRYLFYRTITAGFVNHLVSRMRGANYPAVTDRAVKEILIPLPPLSEQRRIVEILDQADALRRQHAEADAKAARILPALFYQMFGDLTNNHKSWDVARLEQIASSERYITYGIVQAGPHFPDGIPYIRSGDITNGSISTDKLLRTSREIADRYKRSEVKYGDLVFSIRASVGAVAQVPPELDGANLTQGTARIAPGPAVDGLYVLWALRSYGTQSWIERQAKGATFKEITLRTLRDAPVLNPPLEFQKEFATLANRTSSINTVERVATVRLKRLFEILLYSAFSGD